MIADRSILEAALLGFQQQLMQVQIAIAHLKQELGLDGRPEPPQENGRRTMSAAARKRIADAQRKRWAAYHRKHSPRSKG